MEYLYLGGELPAVGVFPPLTERDMKRAYFVRCEDKGHTRISMRLGQIHFDMDNIGDLGQVFGGGN